MSDKDKLLRSINIIQGQLNGISRMIETEADCISILTQMKAIKSGLNRMGEDIAKNQLLNCINQIEKKDQPEYVKELLHTWSRY